MKPTPLARRLSLALAFALATQGAAWAEDQAAALDVFRALNDEGSAVYQDAKRRFLAAADPVLLVGYDSGSFDGVLVRDTSVSGPFSADLSVREICTLSV